MTYKIIRHWTNQFAEDCYELEDGRTLYINFNSDEIREED